MSTYKEIRGLKVRDYTTNPDNPIEGQLWYNKTDQVGKYQIPNQVSSWRTGGNLNTGRAEGASGGLSNAAIFGGGYSGSNETDTELYNGTAWTEVNDLGTAKFAQSGLGTYTSFLSAGVYTSARISNV